MSPNVRVPSKPVEQFGNRNSPVRGLEPSPIQLKGDPDYRSESGFEQVKNENVGNDYDWSPEPVGNDENVNLGKSGVTGFLHTEYSDPVPAQVNGNYKLTSGAGYPVEAEEQLQAGTRHDNSDPFFGEVMGVPSSIDLKREPDVAYDVPNPVPVYAFPELSDDLTGIVSQSTAQERDLKKSMSLFMCIRKARRCRPIPESSNLCFLDCITKINARRNKRSNANSAGLLNRLIYTIDSTLNSICAPLGSTSLELTNLMVGNGKELRTPSQWQKAIGSPAASFNSNFFTHLADTLATFIIENSNSLFTPLRSFLRELNLNKYEFGEEIHYQKVDSRCRVKNPEIGLIGATSKLVSLFEQNMALLDATLPGNVESYIGN
jgi:hypothetical protein